MDYKEYLKTEYWKEFRRITLQKRQICQVCGIRKRRGIVFNIHHKNYRCLFNETNGDVLVLCQLCHEWYHKMKKWKKIYKRGGDLNFIKTKNLSDKIYNMSDYLMPCSRCAENHPVFYKIFKNGAKHLYMACPNSKPRQKAIKFIDGLSIPELGPKSKEIL